MPTCPVSGKLPRELIKVLPVAGAQYQLRSALGKSLGDRPPEAACGAGKKHGSA